MSLSRNDHQIWHAITDISATLSAIFSNNLSKRVIYPCWLAVRWRWNSNWLTWHWTSFRVQPNNVLRRIAWYGSHLPIDDHTTLRRNSHYIWCSRDGGWGFLADLPNRNYKVISHDWSYWRGNRWHGLLSLLNLKAWDSRFLNSLEVRGDGSLWLLLFRIILPSESLYI